MAPGERFRPAPGRGFNVVLRGYDRAHVAEHLRRVDAELRLIVADRDAAADQAAHLGYQLNAARSEAEQLQAQLRRISAAPDSVEGMSERLQYMLRLAQEEMAELRERAFADAAEVVESGRRQSAALGRENEETRDELAALRTSTEAEMRELRARVETETERARAETEQLRAETERARAELDESAAAERAELDESAAAGRAEADEQAAARRAEADEDFRIALAARRAEADRELAETGAARRAEATRVLVEANERAVQLVAGASETAQRITVDAEQEVVMLQALRRRIVQQLNSIRSDVARTAAGLGPLPEEDRPQPAAAEHSPESRPSAISNTPA